MSGRGDQILSRFPAHFEAARPGKQLRGVTEALAGGLDLLADRLAATRRAHRVADAGELRDVMLIAGLHGITRAELAVLDARADMMRALLANLEKTADGPLPDRDKAAYALFDLWGVSGDARLSLFAPAIQPPATPDLGAAAHTMAAAITAMLGYRRSVAAARVRIVNLCRILRQGNGTVAAILMAAANALDFDIDAPRNAAVRAALVARGAAGTLNLAVTDGFFHSADLFRHSSFAVNRLPLVRTVPTLRPQKLVHMNQAIAVSELADQMLLRADQVIPGMNQAGIAPAQPTTQLDLATAEKVAALFNFEVERFARGVATMDATIAVADLSRQLGVPTAEIIGRLGPLGVANATRNSVLPPVTTAIVCRKYGFRLDQRLKPEFEILGIEENPLRRETYPSPDPITGPRKEESFNGHTFDVIRRGFGRELLRVEITGVENRTWGPMIVNRDEGRGVGFFGAVPADRKLVFSEDGKAALDGTDVTASAFSWHGACFADANDPDRHDFTFDSQRSLFAVAVPDGALNSEFTFPHAGKSVEVPGVGVGVTRMAFFIQEAHLSSREGTPEAPVIHAGAPHYAIGFAGGSVFAPALGEPCPPQAEVVLSWLEHEAYALRVIIPSRFKLLEGGGVAITDLVAAALERVRPAGVTLRVEYHDDNWVLGQGTLSAGGIEDPNLMLMGGTMLWPSKTS